jgi:hypothetical protein
MNRDSGEEPQAEVVKPRGSRDKQILGLSTDELAGLSVEELTGNKTAITMVMHYYKVLLDENSSLRNDLNTARTYVEGYGTKKTNSLIGAILLLVANVGIGFGVNLLTANQTWPGLATLIPGLCMAVAGTYFSMKER